MKDKINLQNRKGKRDPLGKSFSDILQRTTSQKDPIIIKSETKIVAAVPEKQFIDITRTLLPADSCQKYKDIRNIGLILKERRERKGLSLDRISGNLCLKISILKSIEDGEWESLPHKVYARGYVRKYADLLGVLDEIMPYLNENNHIQSKGLRGTPNEVILRPDEKRSSFLVSKKMPKAALLYAVVITLTLAFFLVESLKERGAEMSKLENAVQVSSISESGVRKNASSFTDTKKLMITCHERTWISVIIDGTEKKEFTLKPQEVVILNATEKFDLLVGNAGGVKLILDGKDTSFTGENGQVKRVNLS
jgi:cytoskeleton protein RodZ